MSTGHWLITDIATAPIEGVAAFLDPIKADARLKDPEKIAADLKKKQAARDSGGEGATDLDLARITGVGYMLGADPGRATVQLCKTEDDERAALIGLAQLINTESGLPLTLVGYNALDFDWPLLMRRARYLGVKFPRISLGPYYRSSNIDLWAILSDNGKHTWRSLSFYMKRLGHHDLAKTLSGEEEARVHSTGRWKELESSLRHDVMATYRLAEWLEAI